MNFFNFILLALFVVGYVFGLFYVLNYYSTNRKQVFTARFVFNIVAMPFLGWTLFILIIAPKHTRVEAFKTIIDTYPETKNKQNILRFYRKVFSEDFKEIDGEPPAQEVG